MSAIARRPVPPRQRPNQVIVSGPQAQIDRLYPLVPTLPGRTPAGQPAHTAQVLTSYQGTGGGWVKVILVTYQPPAGDDCDHSEEVNARILQLARNSGLTAIRTEPNCTTAAPSPWRGSTYPISWEGNPLGTDPSDSDWEGNPYAKPKGSVQAAVPPVAAAGGNAVEGQSLFAHQDGFQRMGLADNGQRRPALDPYQGSGVRVGVFDTCPPPAALGALPQGQPAWLHPHPAQPPLPTGALVDHGLMIASLINFVAPAAEIHLYQVLDGHVVGDTAILIKGLADFYNVPDTRPAVISLSLGSMCCCGGDMPAVAGLLWEATHKGMVVCAAAGNGGRHGKKPAALPPAQMPASLPYVIAVAAANSQDVRASYSQRGDIAAPGGETQPVQPGPTGFEDVIGLGTTSAASGYVRMDCGTSFATPLVSAAAALVLADLDTRGFVRDGGAWRRVLDQLGASAVLPDANAGTLNSTGLGRGIIRLFERKLFAGF